MTTTTKKVAGSLHYETTTKINDTKQVVIKTRRIFSTLATAAFIKQNNQMVFFKDLLITKPSKFDPDTIRNQHQSIDINELILSIPV